MIEIKKYRVATYIRISKKEKEVNSIENQKDLIACYIKDKQDLKLYDYYVDNGYSGTSFDRPELKRMINDITNKKVDIVIVKDLSRLGRNYIEVGELLDSILPLYDVKLISINDNIDGLNNEEDSYLLKGLLNIYNANLLKNIIDYPPLYPILLKRNIGIIMRDVIRSFLGPPLACILVYT